jgi:chemotaxis family two-component system response regulator Rcp1
MHHAWDGIEAMAFLRREGMQADAPRPALILLDLNTPKMRGRETLALIKQDSNLGSIPAIVLTTLDQEADVLACYKLGRTAICRNLRTGTHSMI